MKATAAGLVTGSSFLALALALFTAGCEARTHAAAIGGDSDRGVAASGPAAADVRREARPAAKASDKNRPAPRCTFRHVNFMIEQDLVLEVRHLVGQFVATGAEPATFDDPKTFSIAIADAEVALDMKSLAAMMNRYVFPGPDAPLRDLEIEPDGARLRIKGKMKKGVVVPFTMVGDVSATPQGEIAITPVEMHAAGVPVRGLLDFFGVELDDLIKESDAVGIRIEENVMFLEPKAILPPPRLQGKVVAVAVEGDRLVQRFGGQKDVPDVEPHAAKDANAMSFRGGVLRFGYLTMEPTDLTLVDADSSDPFLFNLGDYKKHLVAGYSRTLGDGSLVTMMPDYDQAGAPLKTP